LISIDNARMGVQGTIGHCIAHNLYLDKSFNVEWYAGLCREVLEDALVPEVLIEEIITKAKALGKEEAEWLLKGGESSKRLVGDNGGAAIHPAYNSILIGNIIILQNSLEGK
jgi:hypothetical protein